MSKKRYTRVGVEYTPVTRRELLAAVAPGGRTSRAIGDELWPHLLHRGSPHGGPSAGAVAAAFQLHKLAHQGLVRGDYATHHRGPCQWYLTRAGRDWLQTAAATKSPGP